MREIETVAEAVTVVSAQEQVRMNPRTAAALESELTRTQILTGRDADSRESSVQEMCLVGKSFAPPPPVPPFLQTGLS